MIGLDWSPKTPLASPIHLSGCRLIFHNLRVILDPGVIRGSRSSVPWTQREAARK